MTDQRTTLWDKIWKDDTGKVVIYQMPNVWLIGWAVFTVLCLIFTGKVSDILSYIGMVFLAVWAGLEIFKGVNYFRRALGVVVLLVIIADVLGIGR